MDEEKQNEQMEQIDNPVLSDMFEIDLSRTEDDFADLDQLLAKQVGNVLDGEEEVIESVESVAVKKNWFQKIPLWIRIPVLSLFGIILTLVIVINAMLDGIIVKFNGDRLEEQFDVDENNGLEEVDPDSVVWGEDSGELMQSEDVVNILLVGEEAIGSGNARGRTDSIMIASVNFKQGTIKLTSLMRDMYVQIPGYKDNKLNAAYGSGGIPLLEETIELNFDIEIDGSVLVNFQGFESIINSLGGVELTLTAAEAKYLNSTNYVSNPAYRTLKEGKQVLNGNQALGYMRIRYVRTADNTADDFGRTSRQRTLLNAIFDKYKSSSLTDLLVLVNDLLPYVQTDLSKTDIVSYATRVVGMGMGELETFRVPLDNEYDAAYVRSMAVLIPHLPENVAALHDFIFGAEEEDKQEESDNRNGDTSSEPQN